MNYKNLLLFLPLLLTSFNYSSDEPQNHQGTPRFHAINPQEIQCTEQIPFFSRMIQTVVVKTVESSPYPVALRLQFPMDDDHNTKRFGGFTAALKETLLQKIKQSEVTTNSTEGLSKEQLAMVSSQTGKRVTLKINLQSSLDAFVQTPEGYLFSDKPPTTFIDDDGHLQIALFFQAQQNQK